MTEFVGGSYLFFTAYSLANSNGAMYHILFRWRINLCGMMIPLPDGIFPGHLIPVNMAVI
jgi:hypothetical protein